MSTTPPTGDGSPALSTRVLAVLAAAAVVLVVVVVLLVRGGDDPDGVARSSGPSQDPSGTAGTGPTPTLDADGSSRPTPTPGQSAPAPAATPSGTLPEPVRVSLSDPADLGNGVTAAVTEIESVRGVGRGPGESSGPAVRVHVRVTNDSGEDVGMTSSVVTVAYGPRNTPASDLSAPGVKRFPVTIKAGRSADGIFVFKVPPDQRDRVVIVFGYSTEAPTAVFRGSAA